MKNKILKLIFLLTCLSLSLAANMALAQENPALFNPMVSAQGVNSKVNLIQNLPQGSWQQIIANAIYIILGVTGSLAFISFTYGGIMLVTAQGQEEKFRKAKGLLLWSILALVIIGTSYAIVLGITNSAILK
jgi:hypothetical protein